MVISNECQALKARAYVSNVCDIDTGMHSSAVPGYEAAAPECCYVNDDAASNHSRARDIVTNDCSRHEAASNAQVQEHEQLCSRGTFLDCLPRRRLMSSRITADARLLLAAHACATVQLWSQERPIWDRLNTRCLVMKVCLKAISQVSDRKHLVQCLPKLLMKWILLASRAIPRSCCQVTAQSLNVKAPSFR